MEQVMVWSPWEDNWMKLLKENKWTYWLDAWLNEQVMTVESSERMHDWMHKLISWQVNLIEWLNKCMNVQVNYTMTGEPSEWLNEYMNLQVGLGLYCLHPFVSPFMSPQIQLLSMKKEVQEYFVKSIGTMNVTYQNI